MRSGRLGLAAPQVPEGSPRRGEWRQDRQASDRDYSRSNPTEGRAERPTCGSLHLEVLRRGLPLVCNLFVLDLLALVEGRQTGPLYRRDMDENVLAAALRLNEPITFGRVEPLHDTGRHRTLSPFWTFDDTGLPHRIQDVARHARPYGLPSITKKFGQLALDHILKHGRHELAKPVIHSCRLALPQSMRFQQRYLPPDSPSLRRRRRRARHGRRSACPVRSCPVRFWRR